MSFDLFMRQVHAVSTVSGQMSGHVAASRGKLGGAHGTHGSIGGQLLLGDALRLIALLEDITADAFEEIQALEKSEVANAKSMLYLDTKIEQVRSYRDLLEQMVGGLHEALDVVKFEIGELTDLMNEVSHLAQATEDCGVYEEAKEVLQQEILPQMYRTRDELDELMHRAQDALESKEGQIWYMDTVFKYILPLNEQKKMRRKAQKLVDEGLLREDLPEGELRAMRALVKRALRTRHAVDDEEIRAALERFLKVTADAA
jgi:hypothetical protein